MMVSDTQVNVPGVRGEGGWKMSELKPCPFCGNSDWDGEDSVYPSGITWKEDPKIGCKVYGKWLEFEHKCFQVVCDCGAEMHGDSEADAIKNWNTRK
jgi:hypothetical protein